MSTITCCRSCSGVPLRRVPNFKLESYCAPLSRSYSFSFFPKNPSGVGFSFRTVSRESAITKPTRPGRANEEEAVYGGIAEPTGEETKGERNGSSEQTKRKPCTEGTCGGIYPVKLCNSTGLGPGQGGARLHRRRCTGVRGGREGAGAERDNGARGGCTGEDRGDNGARACTGRCRGPGQRAITVHGDGARVYAEGQGGDRGRAR